jgi:hypothetical protein
VVDEGTSPPARADGRPTEDAEAAAQGSGRGTALRATASWAVPLQWAAVAATGGIAAFLALSGRWRVEDWLFVLLFAVYAANAIGFRRLLKRNVP